MSTRWVWMPGWEKPQQTPIGDPTLSLPVIYLYPRRDLSYGHSQRGQAMAEDGRILNMRRSSAVDFLRTDLIDHKRFSAHYPDGYRTEWVDNPDTHAGIAQAHARRRERNQHGDRPAWLNE